MSVPRCGTAALALLATAAVGAGAQQVGTTFSAGVSESVLNSTEQVLLNHTLTPGAEVGALTYFWITGDPSVAFAVIRVYVDGEAAPSLVYAPAAAAGVGLLNTTHGGADVPPWGTPLMGSLGRASYYNTFRVPFQVSVAVTFQAGAGQPDGAMAFLQARGVDGMSLDGIIAGVTLPPTARLRLQVAVDVTYAPLEYMTLASVPNTTRGAFLLSTLWWNATSANTIEGCVRAFTPAGAPFPGMLLSTGFEDYYASSWGFVAGAFTGPFSGVTYWTSPGNLQVGAYRLHTQDPLLFTGGLRLVLRNGETRAANGLKCLLESGGDPVGSPGNTTLSTYAWWYQW
jgi:hypothetical protein